MHTFVGRNHATLRAQSHWSLGKWKESGVHKEDEVDWNKSTFNFQKASRYVYFIFNLFCLCKLRLTRSTFVY